LLHCWQKKYPLFHAIDITGLSHPTVVHWYQRFRAHIPQERLDIILAGDIACDEMFTKKPQAYQIQSHAEL
jgi:hypothetical protein